MVVRCKVCGKQFDSFRGLNGHMNAHLNRMAAEPNMGATIDDTIMDAYLDEGESYDDAEIYARRAMNKLKHSSAEAQLELCNNCSGAGATIAGCTCGYMDYLKNAEGDEELDDEEYWEPYLQALEDYWYACVRYVDRAGDSYRNIVDFIGFWQEVAEESSHSLSYVCEKLWKFKYDAYRMVWNREAERSMDFVFQDLSEESQNLLEDFNPEERDYEGETVYTSVWGGYRHGPPELKIVKEVFNPYWLEKEEGEPYAFDLFRSEENKYTPLSGKRRTKGRNQKWIPVARDYVRQNGKSTAAEIYPSLPSYRGSGTPVNAMALSNRLIRMSDIFIVDKSRKPYTYTLADSKASEEGKTYYGYNPEDDDYYASEQYYAAEQNAESVGTTSKVKVYVEREDNKPWKYVTLEIPTHIVNDEDLRHEAIEARLMDILQEPFGGWDVISIDKIESESFEANYDPAQPRNSDGRWVEQIEVSNFDNSEPMMDLDMDELMALGVAIRLQDETFPGVDMLLEQIGDTAENRQIIFDEMMVVMSNLVNQVVAPTVETPEDYYKYILDEPADDEVERIYRQANYYAQFKNSIEIDGYLEELMEQYTIAKEMGAADDIVDDIERDINFVELVSRVQNMQREFQAPEWNPVQPRVPSTGGGGGGCVNEKGEPVPCPNPGKGGGPNPMGPPMPAHNDQETLWVNRVDGSLWRGLNAPNEDWRKVEMIPVTQNGQQTHIRNIMEDVLKLFPASSVVYRSNPPLLVITDMKFNIDMLANHGFKINNRELTYA